MKAYHHWSELGRNGATGRKALKLGSEDDKTLIVTRLNDDSVVMLSLHPDTVTQLPEDTICLKTRRQGFGASDVERDLEQLLTTTGISLYDEHGGQASSLDLVLPGESTPMTYVSDVDRGTVSFARPSIALPSNLATMRITFKPVAESGAEPTEAEIDD